MIWFTADTHFGHKKISFYAKRKFCLNEEEQKVLDLIWKEKKVASDWCPSWESTSKMDEYILDKINENVKKDDVLWHLGDFCYAKREDYLKQAKKYREKINCKNVFLIKGNHDLNGIESVFDECYEKYELKIENKLVILDHYSHAFWNKSHSGSWMLYGHAHGSAEKWLDENMPSRLSMDVGIDNIFSIFGEYRPVSFFEINQLFKDKKGFHVDGNKIKHFTLKKTKK